MEGSELILKARISAHEAGSKQSLVALEDEADNIASKVVDEAREHSETFEGRQRYKLIAENQDESLGQLTFTFGAKTKDGPNGPEVTESFPANSQGLLGQMMNYNIRITGMLEDLVKATVSPMVEENRALRSERDLVAQRRLDLFRTIESLEGRKQERDIAMREFESSQARRDRLAQKLVDELLPEAAKAVIAGLASKGIIGSSAGTETEAETLLNGTAVPHMQSEFREIYKVIDRGAVQGALSEPDLAALDNLLGVGTDPESKVAFTTELNRLWGELPKDVTDGIGAMLSKEHPEKAVRFLQLLGVKV